MNHVIMWDFVDSCDVGQCCLKRKDWSFSRFGVPNSWQPRKAKVVQVVGMCVICYLSSTPKPRLYHAVPYGYPFFAFLCIVRDAR